MPCSYQVIANPTVDPNDEPPASFDYAKWLVLVNDLETSGRQDVASPVVKLRTRLDDT
jgi:hypothetical protein